MSKNERAPMTSEQRRVYAERVKMLRQSAGLTQEDLAAAAGVSRPTIIGMENGSTVPQQDKLVSILAVLGVDVDGPQFSEQTDLWLSMMGSLIEAIPNPHREPAVNAAIRELSAGVRAGNVGPATDTSVLDEIPVLSAQELAQRDLTKAAYTDPDQEDDDADDARPRPRG